MIEHPTKVIDAEMFARYRNVDKLIEENKIAYKVFDEDYRSKYSHLMV